MKAMDPAKLEAMQLRAAHAREVLKNKVNSETHLTDLQINFVYEYQQDYRATAAYIRAGGSPSNASGAASVLLRNPAIKRLIDEADAERKARYAVTPERIVRELSKMAFTSMEDFVMVRDDGTVVTDFSGVTGDQLAALTEIQVEESIEPAEHDAEGNETKPATKMRRVKFKLSDKRGALELLAKTQKMLVDRKELTGADGAPLQPPALVVNFVKPSPRNANGDLVTDTDTKQLEAG